MSTEIMEQFDEAVEEGLAKEAREADLTPAGRYKFQLERINSLATDTREFIDKEETVKNPFYGKKKASITVRLTSKRDGDKKDSPWVMLDNSKLYSFWVCPSTVKRDDRLTDESRLFGNMQDVVTKAMGAVPPSGQIVLEYFKDNMGEIHITQYEAGVSKKTGKSYNGGNRTQSIKALEA